MDLQKQLDRLERKIDLLTAQQLKRETWVKVGALQDATGWDARQLRKMREAGVIKMKRGKQGICYLLESVPTQFLKQ